MNPLFLKDCFWAWMGVFSCLQTWTQIAAYTIHFPSPQTFDWNYAISIPESPVCQL